MYRLHNRTKCNRLIALKIAHGIYNIQKPHFARTVDTKCENKLFGWSCTFCALHFSTNAKSVSFDGKIIASNLGVLLTHFTASFCASFQLSWVVLSFGCSLVGCFFSTNKVFNCRSRSKWNRSNSISGSLLIAQCMLDHFIFGDPDHIEPPHYGRGTVVVVVICCF